MSSSDALVLAVSKRRTVLILSQLRRVSPPEQQFPVTPRPGISGGWPCAASRMAMSAVPRRGELYTDLSQTKVSTKIHIWSSTQSFWCFTFLVLARWPSCRSSPETETLMADSCTGDAQQLFAAHGVPESCKHTSESASDDGAITSARNLLIQKRSIETENRGDAHPVLVAAVDQPISCAAKEMLVGSIAGQLYSPL